MKTYWQIEAAHCRAHMRLYAMDYRMAIAPESNLTLTERGLSGVAAIRGAVRMRKNAERAMGYHRAYENAKQNVVSTLLPC